MQQTEIYERARVARDRRFDGQFYVGVLDYRHLLSSDLPGELPEARKRKSSFRALRQRARLAIVPVCVAVPKVRRARPHGAERRPLYDVGCG